MADKMDTCWMNIVVAGILLGQSMIGLLSRFASGSSQSRQPEILILAFLFAGLVIPSVHRLTGTREWILLAHSMMCLISGWSPLILLIFIDWIIGERLLPVNLESFGGVVAILALFTLSFVVESGLSFEASRSLTMKFSSLYLLVFSLIRILDQHGVSQRVRVELLDESFNTDSNWKPILSVVVIDVCVIESFEICGREAPIPKDDTPTLSPRAETAPDTATSESTEEELVDQWYYLDLRGFVQGPFPSGVMRSWYHSGFLMDELLVSTRGHDPSSFRTIEYLKSDRTIPFFV